MGYEMRLHVVELYNYDGDKYREGTEIAMIELSGIGNGPVGKLLAAHRYIEPLEEIANNLRSIDDTWGLDKMPAHKRKEKTFSLYANQSGETSEALEMIRERSTEIDDPVLTEAVEIANQYGGHIVTDRYNDPLYMYDIEDVIAAIKQEKSKYRRYDIALATLEAIQKGFQLGN